MDFDLNGKRALVTGSSSGIGAGIVETLAAEGVSVVVHGRNAERAEAVADRIRADGGTAATAVGDLATEDGAAQVADTAAAAFSGIDILVNNAGVLFAGSATETTDEVWRQQFAVNVDGTFFCTRAALRAMLDAGNGGKIVNVASISGLRANPGFAAYCASKAAMVNFTRQAGIDYAADGINVNGVAPGFVETDMTSLYSPEIRAALEGQTPNGRWATSEQIADSVLFLASPLSDHICGEILTVDGGWMVGTPVVVQSA